MNPPKFHCQSCNYTQQRTTCRFCARNLLLDLVAKVAQDMAGARPQLIGETK